MERQHGVLALVQQGLQGVPGEQKRMRLVQNASTTVVQLTKKKEHPSHRQESGVRDAEDDARAFFRVAFADPVEHPHLP